MGRIEINERNKLLTETLSSLMMISLNGPPTEVWRKEEEEIDTIFRFWHQNFNVKIS